MKKEMQEAWDKAFAQPGEAIPVGRAVVCDDCDADWTDRPESGGFVFESKGICPDCAPKWRKLIKRYNEERYIRAFCEPGESFADFIRNWRGPDAFIRVTRGRP